MSEAWYTALLSAEQGDIETLIREYDLDLTTLQILKVRSAEFYYDRPADSVRIAQIAFTLGQYLLPPGAALGRWILANALLFTDHYQDAVRLFEEARADYLALEMPLEAARLGVGQIWALAYIGDFDRAVTLAREIEAVLASSDDPADRKRLAGIYNNLGILYDILGQYEEALTAYDRKLALLNSAATPLEIAHVQHNRGCALTYLNAFDEAWAAFQVAEAGFRAAEAWADLGRLAMNRALLFAVWQRFPEAEAALLEAETLFTSMEGMNQQRYALAVYRALAHLRSGKPLGVDLYAALRVAQEFLTRQGPAFEEGLAWLGLGYGTMEQGDWAASQQAFAQVEELAGAGAGQPLFYLAAEGMARLAQAQAQWETAVTHYEAAVQYIEALRRDLQVNTFRAGFLTDKLHVYQSLVALYLQLSRPDAAFATVERAKSRLLVEQLAGRLKTDLEHLANAEDPAAVSLTLALQEALRTLDLQYQQIRQDDFSARGEHWLPGLEPALSTGIYKLETQVQHLTQQLQRRRPRFSPWATGYTASLAAVQCQLPQNALLLQYAVVNEMIWVFVIDHQGFQTHRCLGPLVDVEAARRRWTAAVERFLGLVGQYSGAHLHRYFPALLADAETQLATLYELLWKPLVAELSSAQLILISPDSVLHYVPFHALLDTSQAPYTYVLERHEIGYAPSATALELSQLQKSTGAGVLLVGYEGTHLTQISAEVARLAELFPAAQVLADVQATAGQVIESAPARRLIHLASHARFRVDNVFLSAFTLADRNLTLAEITQLRLNAELVTLSGCETGRGRLYGTDVIGLAGGFMAAGARSLVVSQWRVDDTITARFMKTFYQHLCTGQTRAAALRAAQLEILELGRVQSATYSQYRHPAYWASFMLVGAWDVLEGL